MENIAEVAANMEARDNFWRWGESQTTKFTTRHAISHQIPPTVNHSSNSQTSALVGVDYEGDTVMGGMKIDLK